MVKSCKFWNKVITSIYFNTPFRISYLNPNSQEISKIYVNKLFSYSWHLHNCCLSCQNIETVVTSVEIKSEHAVVYAEKSETVDETTKEVGNDPENTSKAHMLEELQPNTIVDKEIQSSEHKMDTSGPNCVLDGNI